MLSPVMIQSLVCGLYRYKANSRALELGIIARVIAQTIRECCSRIYCIIYNVIQCSSKGVCYGNSY